VSGQYGRRDETCPVSTGGRGEGGRVVVSARPGASRCRPARAAAALPERLVHAEAKGLRAGGGQAVGWWRVDALKVTFECLTMFANVPSAAGDGRTISNSSLNFAAGRAACAPAQGASVLR